MSHHGRKDADDLDRYYTPEWPVELLLEEIEVDRWGEDVIEPCAGQGHIVDVLCNHGFRVHCSDIDPDSKYNASIDATDPQALRKAFMSDRGYPMAASVITNPPYSADTGTAYQVLDALRTLNVPIAMLLRLSFLEPCSERAAGYATEHLCPSWVGILPRVQYHNGGDSNPQTSMWCVWWPEDTSDTTLHWWTDRDKQRAMGQTSLFGEAE